MPSSHGFAWGKWSKREAPSDEAASRPVSLSPDTNGRGNKSSVPHAFRRMLSGVQGSPQSSPEGRARSRNGFAISRASSPSQKDSVMDANPRALAESLSQSPQSALDMEKDEHNIETRRQAALVKAHVEKQMKNYTKRYRTLGQTSTRMVEGVVDEEDPHYDELCLHAYNLLWNEMADRFMASEDAKTAQKMRQQMHGGFDYGIMDDFIKDWKRGLYPPRISAIDTTPTHSSPLRQDSSLASMNSGSSFDRTLVSTLHGPGTRKMLLRRSDENLRFRGRGTMSPPLPSLPPSPEPEPSPEPSPTPSFTSSLVAEVASSERSEEGADSAKSERPQSNDKSPVEIVEFLELRGDWQEEVEQAKAKEKEDVLTALTEDNVTPTTPSAPRLPEWVPASEEELLEEKQLRDRMRLNLMQEDNEWGTDSSSNSEDEYHTSELGPRDESAMEMPEVKEKMRCDQSR